MYTKGHSHAPLTLNIENEIGSGRSGSFWIHGRHFRINDAYFKMSSELGEISSSYYESLVWFKGRDPKDTRVSSSRQCLWHVTRGVLIHHEFEVTARSAPECLRLIIPPHTSRWLPNPHPPSPLDAHPSRTSFVYVTALNKQLACFESGQ